MTEHQDVDDRPPRWPRRLAVLGSFAAAVGAFVYIIVATLHLGSAANSQASTGPLRVRLIGQLLDPVQSAAGVPLANGEGIIVAGGLDQTGRPLQGIQQFAGSKSTSLGALPTPTHGASAVRIGSTAYLFGGAGSPGGRAILTLPSTTATISKQVAALPRPIADSAAAADDDTGFLFGGSTGRDSTPTVFAWKPGRAPHPTAHLPYRLLYDAAVTVGNQVIIAGGQFNNGYASRAILSFDPIRHLVTTIGQLALPVAHAMIGVIGGDVFVIGGRVKGPSSQTRAIYRVDPKTGVVSFAGALPLPLSDAAVASTAGRILVAGGINRAGNVQRAVYELSLP